MKENSKEIKKQIYLKQKFQNLEKEIQRYQELYYEKDKSEISDYKYDQLLKELEELEKEYPLFANKESPTQKIGSDLSQKELIKDIERLQDKFPPSIDISNSSKTIDTNIDTTNSSKTIDIDLSLLESIHKFKHTIEVLSLGNTYNIPELLAWIMKTLPKIKVWELSVEWKIDGATLVLYYEKGKLIRAVTRGTGSIGEIVTANALKIQNIIPTLKEKITAVVRGEVYMRYSDFESFNQETQTTYANPRNLSAGSLKHKDSLEVAKRPLRWIAFDCFCPELQAKNNKEINNKIKNSGLEVLEQKTLSFGKLIKKSPKLNIIEQSQEIERIITKTIAKFQKQRKKFDIPTDGLVFKIEDLQSRKILGTNNHSPHWAIAYKFPPDTAISKVHTIDIFVGRSGKLTPRATFDQVLLAGSTVKHATLHNQHYMKKLDLRIGSVVRIAKRGEIIPAIEEVIELGQQESFVFPTHCPSCNHVLREKDNELMALHSDPEINKILYFAKYMKINSLNTKTIQELIQHNQITESLDIYFLKKEEVIKIGRITPKRITNLFQEIEDSKKQSFPHLLIALQWKYMTKRTIQTLLNHGYKSLTDIQQGLQQEVKENGTLHKIEEIPELDSFIDSFIIEEWKIFFQKEEALITIKKLRTSNLQLSITQEQWQSDKVQKIFLENENFLFCPNLLCKERVLRSIIFFVGRKQMDIVGLDKGICKILLEKGFILSLADIYLLHKKEEELKNLEGFGELSASKLLRSIENSKQKDFITFITALGLDDLGAETVKVLIEAGYDSIAKLIALPQEINIIQKLMDIHMIGLITAISIIEHFNDQKFQELLKQLEALGLPNQIREKKQSSNSLQGQHWCITGTFETFKPRDAALELIREHGGSASTSFTNKTTHLLAGVSPGSKLQKAEKRNVSVIEEKDFLNLLKSESK